jgi:hypothetical protein
VRLGDEVSTTEKAACPNCSGAAARPAWYLKDRDDSVGDCHEYADFAGSQGGNGWRNFDGRASLRTSSRIGRKEHSPCLAGAEKALIEANDKRVKSLSHKD